MYRNLVIFRVSRRNDMELFPMSLKIVFQRAEKSFEFLANFSSHPRRICTNNFPINNQIGIIHIRNSFRFSSEKLKLEYQKKNLRSIFRRHRIYVNEDDPNKRLLVKHYNMPIRWHITTCSTYLEWARFMGDRSNLISNRSPIRLKKISNRPADNAALIASVRLKWNAMFGRPLT